jgi:hypothetical protein
MHLGEAISMTRSKEFRNHIFEISHYSCNASVLLSPFKIEFNDRLDKKYKRYISLLDNGARIIGKFIFLKEHLDRYVHRVYHLHDDPSESYYHIDDQVSESYMALLHSIMLARIGLVLDAITTLRRSFEAAVYGSFFATTFVIIDDENYNPFVQFVAKNNHFMSSPIRYMDLKEIIHSLKKQKSIPRDKATEVILTDFSNYYLNNFCNPRCKNHYNKKQDPICSLGSAVSRKCDICQNRTSEVIVERSVTFDLMIGVIEAKLNNRIFKFNMIKLYSDLSRYVHPNYQSHQHEPKFNVTELKEWLRHLKNTVNTIIWLYIDTLKYIGYQETETNKLMNSKKYDLNGILITSP